MGRAERNKQKAMNPMMLPLQQKMQSVMMNTMNRVMNGNNMSKAPRSTFHEEMRKYFSDIKDGKEEIPDAMAEAICLACAKAIAAYMGEHELMKEKLNECSETGELMTEEHEKHKKFKELVEVLRDISDTGRKQAFIKEHFSELTADEEKLLMRLSMDYSKKRHADALHVTLEEMGRIKKNIENKIKQ